MCSAEARAVDLEQGRLHLIWAPTKFTTVFISLYIYIYSARHCWETSHRQWSHDQESSANCRSLKLDLTAQSRGKPAVCPHLSVDRQTDRWIDTQTDRQIDIFQLATSLSSKLNSSPPDYVRFDAAFHSLTLFVSFFVSHCTVSLLKAKHAGEKKTECWGGSGCFLPILSEGLKWRPLLLHDGQLEALFSNCDIGMWARASAAF